LKIHQEARRVEQMLGELRSRFERFRDHFVKIGRHLDHAQAQFVGAARDVERFQTTLDGLKVGRIDAVESDDTVELRSAESEPLLDLRASKAPEVVV
jgi:DNA anti-recombination protein RmuC